MDLDEKYTIHHDAHGGFIYLAEMFCDFVESSTSVNSMDFLKATQLYLLKIYQLASCIKKIESGSESLFSDTLSDAQFGKIVEVLKNKLGDCGYYLIVFDPIKDGDTEPVCGDLLDDVGDIYRDIKRALVLYDSGLNDAKAMAIWQVKFNFENHWGHHCINAIYASHYFLRK